MLVMGERWGSQLPLANGNGLLCLNPCCCCSLIGRSPEVKARTRPAPAREAVPTAVARAPQPSPLAGSLHARISDLTIIFLLFRHCIGHAPPVRARRPSSVVPVPVHGVLARSPSGTRWTVLVHGFWVTLLRCACAMLRYGLLEQ